MQNLNNLYPLPLNIDLQSRRSEMRTFSLLALSLLIFCWNGIAPSHAMSFPDTDLAQLLSTGQCKDCELVTVDLEETDLIGANLQSANLLAANLRGVRLQGANLKDADLGGVDLEGADLSSADLEEAYLESAILKLANLTNANLTATGLDGVLFCNTTMPDGSTNDSGC